MTIWRQLTMQDAMAEFHDGPHATPPPAAAGPVFLGIRNITEGGRLDLSDIRCISEDDYARWTRRVTPQPDDVVFTYEATLHRYALIPEGFRGCLGRRLALVRSNRSVVLPRFLHFLFLSPEWRNTVTERVISGSTVDRIPLIDFPAFPIRIPDIEYQRRVIEFLGAIDDLIENNRRRIELLEQMAQAIYREWFVHLRHPGYENDKLVDSPLGPIPSGWEARPLDAIASVIRGRSYRGRELVENGGVPFVNLKCMKRGGGFRRDGLKRYTGVHSDAQCVRAGDIIVAVTDLTQTREILARATRVPRLDEEFGVISLDVVRLIPKETTDHLPLLAMLAYSDFADRVKEHANGSTVLHLAVRDLASAAVLWPSQAIRRSFGDLISPLLRLSDVLDVAAMRLERIRDLLLPKLVTGEIDVSTLDLDAIVGGAVV